MRQVYILALLGRILDCGYTAGMTTELKIKTHMTEVREARGLTVRQVADATGISRSTVYRIEVGDTVPRREHARALYAFYDYEVDLADIYDPLYDFEVNGAT